MGAIDTAKLEGAVLSSPSKNESDAQETIEGKATPTLDGSEELEDRDEKQDLEIGEALSEGKESLNVRHKWSVNFEVEKEGKFR